MLATALEPAPEPTSQDHIVVLSGVTWADYQRMLEVRGDRPTPRLAYLKGRLELMSPSANHESIKSMIGRLVEVYCLERDIEFHTLGSWTLEEKALERGVEPDECYVFGGRQAATRPDLALEVVWTSGGLNELEIYRKLEVPEVWFWRRGVITVHRLGPEGYTEAAASEALPGVDLIELASFVGEPTTSAAIRAYREALGSKQR